MFLDGPDQFAGFELICNWIQNGSSRSGLFVDGNRNVKPSANRPPLILQNLFANQTNNVGINMGSRSFDSGIIAMNTFTNNGFDGLQGGPKDSLIISNLFVGNKRWGLALTSFGNTGAGRGATNDTVTCNTFTLNGDKLCWYQWMAAARRSSAATSCGAFYSAASKPSGTMTSTWSSHASNRECTQVV